MLSRIYMAIRYLLLGVNTRQTLWASFLGKAAITSSVRDGWIGSRSKSKSIKSIGSGSRSKLDPFLGHVR